MRSNISLATAAWQAAKSGLGADLIWCPAVRDAAVAKEIFDQERSALIRRDPTLNLPIERWPSCDAFRQELRRKFVDDQDRRLRRLLEQGNISFRQLDETHEIERTLHWMFRHKTAWAKRMAVRTHFTEHYRRYLSAICEDALAAGNLLFGVLTMDNEIIAAEIDIIDGPRLEMLIGAYDRDWKSFGPGSLLFERMLAWAFERNLAVVDFRIGAERYKRNFPAEEAWLCSYLVPCTVKGWRVVAWRRLALRTRVTKALTQLGPVGQWLISRLRSAS